MLTKRHAGTARRLLPVLLAATAVLASTTALASDKINVGALRFTSHSASFIAFEKGYFEEAGLDVEFKYFQAAAPMAVAIASGDIDYGITAITGGLINLADKAPSRSSAARCTRSRGSTAPRSWSPKPHGMMA